MESIMARNTNDVLENNSELTATQKKNLRQRKKQRERKLKLRELESDAKAVAMDAKAMAVSGVTEATEVVEAAGSTILGGLKSVMTTVFPALTSTEAPLSDPIADALVEKLTGHVPDFGQGVSETTTTTAPAISSTITVPTTDMLPAAAVASATVNTVEGEIKISAVKRVNGDTEVIRMHPAEHERIVLPVEVVIDKVPTTIVHDVKPIIVDSVKPVLVKHEHITKVVEERPVIVKERSEVAEITEEQTEFERVDKGVVATRKVEAKLPQLHSGDEPQQDVVISHQAEHTQVVAPTKVVIDKLPTTIIHDVKPIIVEKVKPVLIKHEHMTKVIEERPVIVHEQRPVDEITEEKLIIDKNLPEALSVLEPPRPTAAS